MDAAAAVKNLDNHALDKAHVFRVNHFDDFLLADKAATEYKAPEETPFDENVRISSRYFRSYLYLHFHVGRGLVPMAP